jgi:O-antigen ligase
MLNLPISSYRNSAALTVFVVLIAVSMAIFVGLLGATIGWFGQIVFFSIFLPVVVLIFNYRIALFLLIFLIPYSQALFWPKVGPLSIVNLLLLGTIGIYLLRQVLESFGNRAFKSFIPRDFLLFYWLPVTLGFVIGSFHLHEIPSHALVYSDRIADQGFYWITLYLKGMLIAISAFVLANSFPDQRSGRKIVYFCLASGVLLVAVGIFGWAASGVNFEAAVGGRNMFVFTGTHPNVIGFLLLPLIGVSIYLRSAMVRTWSRIALLSVSVILIVGVIIAGSRGGLIGLFALLTYLLISTKDIRTILLVLLLAAGVAFLMPDAVLERLTLGVEQAIEDRTFVAKGDQLTSGRLYIYSQLFPDIISSPFFGNGITSIRWSALTREWAYFSHPHSLYVSLIMDLGIVGSVAMVVFAVTFFRLFGALGRSDDIDPVLKKYFLGLRAGFVGYLGCALGIGDPYPTHEQWFLWIGIAMAFRYKSFLSAEGRLSNPLPRSNELRVG